MILRILFVLSMCVGLRAQTLVDGAEGDCGFASYRAGRITHFIEKGAVSKVVPIFPPAAKAKSLSAIVRVRLLVNKQGLVERTCPVYVDGQAKPDRILVIAAEAAALQWIYPPNFGIKPGDGIKINYVEGIVTFDFVPEPKKENKLEKY
jgi:hypothetical protein